MDLQKMILSVLLVVMLANNLFSQVSNVSTANKYYELQRENDSVAVYESAYIESHGRIMINKLKGTFEFYYANTDMLLGYSVGHFFLVDSNFILKSDRTLVYTDTPSIFSKPNWPEYRFIEFKNAHFLLSGRRIAELPPITDKESRKGKLIIKDICN